MFIYCKCTLYSIHNYNFTFPLTRVWAHTKYNMYIKCYREIYLSHLHVHIQKPSRQQISPSEFKALNQELALKTAEPSLTHCRSHEDKYIQILIFFFPLNTKLSPTRVISICLSAAGALMHTVYSVAHEPAHKRQRDKEARLQSCICSAPDGFSADPRSQLYSGQVN